MCSSSNIIHETQIFSGFYLCRFGIVFAIVVCRKDLIADPIAFDFAGGWAAQNLLNHIMLMEYLYTRSKSYPPQCVAAEGKGWNVIQILKLPYIRLNKSAPHIFYPMAKALKCLKYFKIIATHKLFTQGDHII